LGSVDLVKANIEIINILGGAQWVNNVWGSSVNYDGVVANVDICINFGESYLSQQGEALQAKFQA